jgi:hypothetical protein
VSDEEYEASKRGVNGMTRGAEEWEDPRQGELYGLVMAVRRAEMGD